MILGTVTSRSLLSSQHMTDHHREYNGAASGRWQLTEHVHPPNVFTLKCSEWVATDIEGYMHPLQTSSLASRSFDNGRFADLRRRSASHDKEDISVKPVPLCVYR